MVRLKNDLQAKERDIILHALKKFNSNFPSCKSDNGEIVNPFPNCEELATEHINAVRSTVFPFTSKEYLLAWYFLNSRITSFT
ncbi:MAG: hypothetical protein IPO32_10865 [Crocinitomicaceae bacterium]|nr:hypothetical protein [Crocinitomicaceae bacterium]